MYINLSHMYIFLDFKRVKKYIIYIDTLVVQLYVYVLGKGLYVSVSFVSYIMIGI